MRTLRTRDYFLLPLTFALSVSLANLCQPEPAHAQPPRDAVARVIDGDTVDLGNGERLRFSDIDAPELHSPGCPAELQLARRATERVRQLVRAYVTSVVREDRVDRYGRTLGLLMVRGVSVGEILESEGLARHWEGRRRPWCDRRGRLIP